MNNVSLIGRITRDVELSTTQNGKMFSKFTLAIQRDKENADFINCIAWNKTAEVAATYAGKGSQIGVIGSIQTGSYENKDGHKVYTFEVWVNRLNLLDSKKDKPQTTQSKDPFEGGPVIDISDDDVPF